MDIFLRTVAIFIEVLILATLMYSLLKGVLLILLDLGVGQKYKKMLTVFLATIGTFSVVFFIAHLTSFYPTIGG